VSGGGVDATASATFPLLVSLIAMHKN